MPTYRYQLIADIEVDAPNIVAAEKAVTGVDCSSGFPMIRGFGSHIGGVHLPSMPKGVYYYVEVSVDRGKIKRIGK